MKSRTVPEVIQVTIYGCDHCDFEHKNQDAVKLHIADYHLCLEEKNGIYRFDSEENALEWLKTLFKRYYTYEVEWQGPGWYKPETWWHPCFESCYREECIRCSREEGIKLQPVTQDDSQN